MSLDIALEELSQRQREQAAVETIGTWDAFAAMKHARALRRRQLKWPRSKMKAWLAIAEQHGVKA
jgi:hypothetical protein